MWTQHHHMMNQLRPNPNPNSNPTLRSFNLNKDDQSNNGNGEVVRIEKEPMFEKPLTPSDVGKLNRLVIPKQHAENYFPLSGGVGVEKGLLLAFEDESGKWWRFRYSYWNSSQSYVLTKGWSRYVKEKRLDAGDVVLFERHGDHFFIGWRRRNTAPAAVPPQTSRVFYSAHPYPYPAHHDAVLLCQHAAGGSIVPAGNLKRRLRLFGVNMECQTDESEGSAVLSQLGAAHCHYLHQQQDHYYLSQL